MNEIDAFILIGVAVLVVIVAFYLWWMYTFHPFTIVKNSTAVTNTPLVTGTHLSIVKKPNHIPEMLIYLPNGTILKGAVLK